MSVGRLRSKTEVVREGPTAKPKYNEVVSFGLQLCVVGLEVDCTSRMGEMELRVRSRWKVSEGVRNQWQSEVCWE